jgi:hypothetical protein
VLDPTEGIPTLDIVVGLAWSYDAGGGDVIGMVSLARQVKCSDSQCLIISVEANVMRGLHGGDWATIPRMFAHRY